MGRQTDRLDLRIDPELREAIEQIAAARDRSVAWIVRDALKRYAEQEAGQPMSREQALAMRGAHTITEVPGDTRPSS